VYYRYFGVEQPPFRITPDTRLFFPGGNRGAVLEALIYAIANGEGIVKVVGEVGSGKTMLCRMLEEQLPEHVDVVYLANPNLSPDDILHAIALELKLPLSAGESRLDVMQKLNAFLLEKHAANRRVVAFIEEAQGMPLETLEEIRLLSNLETKVDKLLQIVLFGQPELDQRLAAHAIRQLRDRITYSFALEPLSVDEIGAYLASRLRASGARATDLFNSSAVRAIAQYSGGLLRRINVLADKSMLAAFADNSGTITANHVKRAVSDGEARGPRITSARWRWAALGVAASAAVAALVWVAGGPWVTPPAPPATSAARDAGPASQPLAPPARATAPEPAAHASDPATAAGSGPALPGDAALDLAPRLTPARILELASEHAASATTAEPPRNAPATR
jgi:type II secretory pathway predicted ATPase ExeA